MKFKHGYERIKFNPLVKSERVLLPTLQIKLDLINNFVETLVKNRSKS